MQEDRMLVFVIVLNILCMHGQLISSLDVTTEI